MEKNILYSVYKKLEIVKGRDIHVMDFKCNVWIDFSRIKGYLNISLGFRYYLKWTIYI